MTSHRNLVESLEEDLDTAMTEINTLRRRLIESNALLSVLLDEENVADDARSEVAVQFQYNQETLDK